MPPDGGPDKKRVLVPASVGDTFDITFKHAGVLLHVPDRLLTPEPPSGHFPENTQIPRFSATSVGRVFLVYYDDSRRELTTYQIDITK
jgi:hypothetical protein